jgi:IMP dehydrogenase
MVKEILGDYKAAGRTFSEFSLLPGYTKADCIPANVDLETKLGSLVLRIPMISAAMTSVTGYEMALALGKEGGLGILPAKLPIEEQADIVQRIKKHEMSFVDEPQKARETATVEAVLRILARYGHSKIPIVDRNNQFLGLFDQQRYLESNARPKDSVKTVMIPFDGGAIPFVNNESITVDEAKKHLEGVGKNYLVVLDKQNRLVKLAFKKDEETVKVGAAISTYPGWDKRVEALVRAGVDLVSIDTSDAHSEFVDKVIQGYKAMKTGAPLCVGNIVTYEAARHLMEQGADAVKIGMSSGSICITKRQKSVGRAPMTALIEAGRAQADHMKEKKSYVPIIMDGGIATSADMIIALTIADAIMMGGYFNHFFEAAGEKLDRSGAETTDESKMVSVATWGEGSLRAQNLDRYGHETKRTFFEEGKLGRVPYLGRLKPTLKQDLMKVRAALCNAGSLSLHELRRDSSVELNSLTSNDILANTHNMEVRE